MRAEDGGALPRAGGTDVLPQPFVQDTDVTLWHGDCIDVLRALPDKAAYACVTSPPYLDARPEYNSFDRYHELFAEFRRVVTDAALFNVGRVFRAGIEQLWWIDIVNAARAEGWELVDTLVWTKPNANPIQGNVFTNAHEYVLIFVCGGARLNEDGIRTPYPPETLRRYERGFKANAGVKGHDRPLHRRNRPVGADERGARARSYVEFHTGGEKGNPHPAPMPVGLAEHLVTLATFPGGTVLDPFFGSGTTGVAVRKLGRNVIGIESSSSYCHMAAARLGQQSLLAEASA